MSVRKFWVAGDPHKTLELTAEVIQNALEPSGVIFNENTGSNLDLSNLNEGVAQVVRIASLCNVATIHQNLRGEWKSTGDPTEVALQVFATKMKLGRPSLTTDAALPEDTHLRPAMGPVVEKNGSSNEKVNFVEDKKTSNQRYELKLEFPFSSDLKRMSTIYSDKKVTTFKFASYNYIKNC